MKSKGKLVIIGGAVNKGSFTETNFDQNVEKNLNFFERGILRKIIDESKLKEDSVIEVITNHPTVFSSCCACILFFNVTRYRMTTNTTDKTSATGCAQSSPSIPIIDCKIKITGI